jgi:hypothetical protein
MENKITDVNFEVLRNGKKEYVPFGDEWHNEVKKLDKKTLIYLFRETARAKMELQYKIGEIIPTNEELTRLRTYFVKEQGAGAEGCSYFSYGIDLIKQRIDKLLK